MRSPKVGSKLRSKQERKCKEMRLERSTGAGSECGEP